MLMHCDNHTVIYKANNLVFHERTKHIEVDYHFVRDCVTSEMISTFTPSLEHLVDIFTKVVSSKIFLILCSKLGMIHTHTVQLEEC